ncbi:uncharacterized protein isoform X1 [Musca autumnalis]|uniref:uncharacterized protein isoform X1 n=1 Tax=Musca autumnalis TaxID=221902 RepID=UPI003CEC2876
MSILKEVTQLIWILTNLVVTPMKTPAGPVPLKDNIPKNQNKAGYKVPRRCKWIVELNDQEVKCKYCQSTLKPKISKLLTHGKSTKHLAAASPFTKNNQKTSEFPILSSNSKVKEAELLEA